MDNNVFVLDANKATLLALPYSSSVAFFIPKTFCWFGHISTQTLNNIMVPNQEPKPIASYPFCNKNASEKFAPSNAAPASHVANAAHLNHNNARGATCLVIPPALPSAAAAFKAGTCTKLK